MTKIGNRLRRITTANGFLTNVGATVFEGLLMEGEPPVMPMANFADINESVSKVYQMTEKVLQVQIATYDKLTYPSAETLPDKITQVARRQLADVEVAMYHHETHYGMDRRFDGLVDRLDYTDSELVIGVGAELWVGCISRWAVTYKTRTGNPYTQTEET